jgi:putative glycosyltransferase (TIGR04348 family)
MKLLIVTPASRGSFSGNYTTAARIGWLLKNTGIQATVSEAFERQDVDLLLAIHAEKSRRSIKRFHQAHPNRPVIVLLAGTDIYRRPLSHACLESLHLADSLVALQDLAIERLPAALRARAITIHQSACPPHRPTRTLQKYFEVAVVANLRAVKDPLRTLMATRDLPRELRVVVTHMGQAISDSLAERARREYETSNHRYRWVGGRPAHQALRLIQRSRLLVVSSRSEGGANVVSEAIACGTPVLGSRIDGNIGLLGEDYPGYFPVGETAALRKLILRAVQDPDWLARLRQYILKLQPAFSPETERAAWLDLLNNVQNQAGG